MINHHCYHYLVAVVYPNFNCVGVCRLSFNMQRLLIVSNRLPINVSKGDTSEKWKFQLSSGGLVSALSGVQKSAKFVWIGWPGE